jgi:regulator of protease activity HflC (stomatin/prohibitin superfamily)
MALEMRAERTKRAAVLEAAGLKSAEIARAEGAKAAQVLTAEGHKQAQVLNAEGERDAAILQAEARKALAEAEANATQILSEAIKSGDPQALQYFLGGKYIEAWGKLAESNNSKFVLVPSEMTALSGLMAGLKNFVNKS